MTDKTKQLSVRLRMSDLAVIDGVAEKRGCTRAEAARIALLFGIPMLSHGHSLNITRVAILLEYIQAGLDVIISREHTDVADQLLDIAMERVSQFHA